MKKKQYVLKVTAGVLAGREFPVSKESLNLGRSSSCDICIKDLLLSRTHCRFEIRDSKLFVIDLASANETIVNGKVVDERELRNGDLIEVGESTLMVVCEGEDDMPVRPPVEGDDVVIDLGFNKSEEDADTEKKLFLRPVIWSVAAILVLVIGVLFIFNFEKAEPDKKVAVDAEQSTELLIQYEKIEADSDNIFRYSLRLSPDGILQAEIDDIAGDRHIKKDKQLSQSVVDELARIIRNSGFFGLERKYSGYASTPGTMMQWRMTIALGTQINSCTVRDRLEPDIFRSLRETLETFSKNELGIWAIQFSAERLIELAVDAKAVADKKSAERNVRHNNLFDAIKSYKEAIFYLDTVNPKPDFYAELVGAVETCERELEKRYEEQRFKADRAINLQEWANAARELKILREMIPDHNDPRHGEAVRKLLDVEGRL